MKTRIERILHRDGSVEMFLFKDNIEIGKATKSGWIRYSFNDIEQLNAQDRWQLSGNN